MFHFLKKDFNLKEQIESDTVAVVNFEHDVISVKNRCDEILRLLKEAQDNPRIANSKRNQIVSKLKSILHMFHKGEKPIKKLIREEMNQKI